MTPEEQLRRTPVFSFPGYSTVIGCNFDLSVRFSVLRLKRLYYAVK